MHFTDIPPVQCSVCFQQQPDLLHVDMDAAYDGPVLDVSGARHSIDDIIVCETCVRAANSMLPEARELQDRYDTLAQQYRELIDYVTLVQGGISNFEQALTKKLDPLRPSAKKPAGRAGAVKVRV